MKMRVYTNEQPLLHDSIIHPCEDKDFYNAITNELEIAKGDEFYIKNADTQHTTGNVAVFKDPRKPNPEGIGRGFGINLNPDQLALLRRNSEEVTL